MLKVKELVRQLTEQNKEDIIRHLRNRRDYMLFIECPITCENFFSAGYIELTNGVARYRVKVVTRLSDQTLIIQYTRV